MKLPILTFFLFAAIRINAQPRYGKGTLNANRWEVQFNTSGMHGTDLGGDAKTHFQGDSLFSPIEGFSLWVGGLYKGNIHTIASANFQNGTDYAPGPLRVDKPIKVHDTSRLSYWNQVFDINRKDIRLHLDDSATSESIKDWPGNGSSAFREPKIVAPFQDLNGNGKYEPLKGEYPIMIGDEMLWIMANDDVIKRQSGSQVMSMNVETKAYAFKCSDDSLLNRTFFVQYEIVNHGERVYDSVYISQFVDFAFGNPHDDILGSIKDVGAFGFDGKSSSTNKSFERPIASVQCLDRNASVVHLLPHYKIPNGNPRVNPIHYYGSMTPSSEWPFIPRSSDSLELMQNPFRFSGNPFSDTAYNMRNFDSGSEPKDYYAVVSTGPFTVKPDDVLTTTWAFTLHLPENEDSDATYQKMLSEMKSIRETFSKTGMDNPCTSVLDGGFSEEEKPAAYIYMYPNPARDMVVINANYPVVSTQIMSLKGQVVLSSQSNETELNVGHLTPGLYLAKVKTEEGASAFKLRVE